MGNQGYSLKGFLGVINHYDEDGNKVGESRPDVFGGYDKLNDTREIFVVDICI